MVFFENDIAYIFEDPGILHKIGCCKTANFQIGFRINLFCMMLENVAKGITALNLFFGHKYETAQVVSTIKQHKSGICCSNINSAILGVAVKSPYLVCNIFWPFKLG